MKTTIDQNNTEAEGIKKEVFNVSSQTELYTSPSFDISLEHKLSTPHGYSSNPGNFSNQTATH